MTNPPSENSSDSTPEAAGTGRATRDDERVLGPLSGLAAAGPQGARPAVSDEPSVLSQPFQFTSYGLKTRSEDNTQINQKEVRMPALRDLMLTDRFWRWAWIASGVGVVLVILCVCLLWQDIVQAWPAAARLHQPG
ncbi:hypothetical protein [Acetobacter malorum]|uniref:Uncharacterized protein n=1 Tax=Acetobacter malorum TaxID=178901 RepID=A0A1Y3GBM8_9PROT|nr:hypothetical protein [Acetobacter malorum]OUJ07279.1 hypothetical protein HK23_12005 [Acetobacter malorum]